MPRAYARPTLAALVILGLPLPASAQLPPATPEQRQAGERVATIDFGVEELVVERGATIPLEVRFLDADGNEERPA